MTKLAILSDIHANLPALEAVIEDLSQFKVDFVIVPEIDCFSRWRTLHYPNEPLSKDLFTEYVEKYQWWEFAHKAYHINL